MGQWEYLTKFIRAEARGEARDFLESKWPEWKKPPKYTPESMIPELNALGNAGWELIHMEPVADVGRKGDVRFEGDGVKWSNIYFCVFKRVRSSDAHPTAAASSRATAPPDTLPEFETDVRAAPTHSPHAAPPDASPLDGFPLPLDDDPETGRVEKVAVPPGEQKPVHSPRPAPPGDSARAD